MLRVVLRVTGSEGWRFREVFVAETDIGFAVGTDGGMLLVHVLGVGINGLPSLGGHALVDTRSIDR
ncbi:hypothetical protein N9018_01425 [Rhodopirellula sp.]|nr:hypothetical protein [Rhodopirellula sp.]MDB4476843.1 hypothetical protein [Rhodopirellula sp.]